VFHLNNNEAKAAREQSGHDPHFKIRPVLDTLITKFQDVCTPEEQLSIDKTIYHLRGYILVYIKGKPLRYGIKLFELVRQKEATSTAG